MFPACCLSMGRTASMLPVGHRRRHRHHPLRCPKQLFRTMLMFLRGIGRFRSIIACDYWAPDEVVVVRLWQHTMERQQWDRREGEMQSRLDDSWNHFLSTLKEEDDDADCPRKRKILDSSDKNNNSGVNNQKVTRDKDSNGGQQATEENDDRIDGAAAAMKRLEWNNYFMPPHPPTNLYSCPLPFDRIGETITHTPPPPPPQQQQQQPTPPPTTSIHPKSSLLHSYNCGLHPINNSTTTDSLDNEWRRNTLSETLRKWMETCDTVRGFQINIDRDMALFGGLAERVLQELGEECRSAGRVSVLMEGGGLLCVWSSLELTFGNML